MLKQVIKRLPGFRSLIAQRDYLLKELEKWKYQQEFLPGHYYSPIPDHEDLINYFDNRIDPSQVKDIGGIELYWSEQISLLKDLANRFYKDIPFSEHQRTDNNNRYFYENGFFTYADGIILYSLLRYLKPKNLIEVGSGFSSSLILDVNEQFLDNSINCIFIEPYPDRLIRNLRSADRSRITIIQEKVQEQDLEMFEHLQPGDILLIDSSHVSKAVSDVNFLVFDVLPRLKSGVWIHFHDIFYPFEYLEEWVRGGRSWNEAYLLRALLMFNQNFKIKLWGNALAVRYPEILQEYMPLCLKNSGASLWLRKE